MRWISSGATESKTSPLRLSGTSSGLKSNFPVILWRFLNFFEATSGSVVPILRKLNPCEFKNPRYQFTFTLCGLPGSLTTQFTCWRSNLKKSCLVSPDSKHRKSWTKMKWKPNETLLIVFEISLQYQIRMNFKDERTITILFIFFFIWKTL